MHQAPSALWPGGRLMPFLLAGGLILKIALSGLYLAPPAVWSWLWPKVSEAATPPASGPNNLAVGPRLLPLLQQERQSLKAREAAVAVREEVLNTLRQEVEERLEELKTLQLQVLQALEEERRLKSEHHRHLVATLSAMPAERAGRLLEKMDEKVAVRVLRSLKGKEAGAILAVLAPDKAARLSQRLLQ
ncbi:MAG: hypothetical protein JRI59_04555 [Deltaproteobacteria bacterium]|nr:hypothetical protein [Deltaproteobacteria bacterium]